MPKPRLFSKDDVLQAINDLLVNRGKPPTVEELKKKLGVGSIRTVLRYLDWLETDGDIERWGGARGIRLRRATGGLDTVSIPVVGEVPAGPLMLADENVEGWVRLPPASVRPTSARFFFLRVRGDSMNRALVNGKLIESGDLVLVRQQSAADPGAIVVALIDGEATIKRFMQGDGYYYLRPESTNPEHQPIVLDERFGVQGIVIDVLKKGTTLLNEQGN